MATQVAGKDSRKMQRSEGVGADFVEVTISAGNTGISNLWDGDQVWSRQIVGPAGFLDQVLAAVKRVVGELTAAQGAIVDYDSGE